MNILVDSDVLIEVTRKRDDNLLSQWVDLSQSDSVILYSPVSAAELWAGARPREHEAISQLFRAFLCAPIDYGVGQQAGAYLLQYRKSHGTELGDALIAATAVRNDAKLWTRNRKHYPMKDLSFY